MMCPNIKLF